MIPDARSTTQEQPAPWYGLRVRSRSERLASAALRVRGYEPFLPSYKALRRWSDRVKEIEFPLFPGYVFCRLDPANRLRAMEAPGVVEIVGIGKTPAPIDDREIEAIQAVLACGLAVQPLAGFGTGDKVRVERGPLRGVEGVVAELWRAAQAGRLDPPAATFDCGGTGPDLG